MATMLTSAAAPSKTAITYLRVSTADQATRGGTQKGSRSPRSEMPIRAKPRP